MQVAAMKLVVEGKKGVVATAKANCEELLVEIVQDKRVADEQEKQVGVGVGVAARERGGMCGGCLAWGHVCAGACT